MKRTVATGLLGILFAFTLTASGSRRDAAWKRVETAAHAGLPKTAIAILDSIAADAMAHGALPEAVRATTQRIAFAGEVQGGKAEEKIHALEAVLKNAPRSARPVYEAILAHWYWQYFRDNQWRFMQRTQTAQKPSDDFTTWDLPRIYAEIDRHFQRALADDDRLKRAPIREWDVLAARGNAPDAWRPTLYDFVAFDALGFYQSGEQAAARPEESFVLDGKGPVLGDADAFLAWRPTTTDSLSPTLRAVRIYQDLLRFHQRDRDCSAFLDADLWRLEFARNKAVGAQVGERYRQAMEDLAAGYADHELSARALRNWAQVLEERGDLVGAVRVARRGADRFPNSAGGHACANLIARIQAPSLTLGASRVWLHRRSQVIVHHRNVGAIDLKLIPVNVETLLARTPSEIDRPTAELLDSLEADGNVLAWSAELPATADYRERTDSIATPDRIAPGAYYLRAVARPAGFGPQEYVVLVWVSELALVRREGGQGLDGLVVEAADGDPVGDAEVRIWRRNPNWNWNRPFYVRAGAMRTGVDGRFTDPSADGSVWLMVRRGDQVIGGPDNAYNSRREETTDRRTLFFTDRAIYRPGQTIQFKGLCIQVDTGHDRYGVLAGESLEVVFRDGNAKEIARQKVRSNAWGSFSGTFTAPSDRLLGTMFLGVEGVPRGSTWLRIEEYKRPKFEVAIDAPRTPARLEDTVRLTGHATGYTGAPVDGAKVVWRVTRSVMYAEWWYGSGAGAQEIAHGETQTDADGAFAIAFPARPQPGVSREGQPVFAFSVSADVTEPAGETRQAARGVMVGFAALRAALSSDDWQTDERPVELGVGTTTINGEGRATTGTLTVRRLSPPPLREEDADDNGSNDVTTDDSWRVASPGRPAIANWREANVVVTRTIATDSLGGARTSLALEAGVYRVRFETHDAFGEPVVAERIVQVFSPRASRFVLPDPMRIAAPAWSVEAGSEFVALWGSGFANARAYVEVEHRGRVIQAWWTPRGSTQVMIRQTVTEAMRGGFIVRVTMVHGGRLYFHSRRVDVPWSNQHLALRWERFRSKLQPGARETWTAVVTGPKRARVAPEMVATLYDASLDAFQPLSWPGLDVFRQDGGRLSSWMEPRSVGLQPIRGWWQIPSLDESVEYRTFAVGLLAAPYEMQAAAGAPSVTVVKQMEQIQVRAEKSIDTKSSTTKQTVSGETLRELPVDNIRGAVGMKDAAISVAAVHARGGRGNESSLVLPSAPPPALDQVVARRNLQETAFFMPHLQAGPNGEIRMEFTMPEALTRWRFLGLAHDASLRWGMLEGTTVTATDLMVQPNPPRFLREGDVLEFTVKVTNQSKTAQRGNVRLSFTDARNGGSANAALANAAPEQALDIPAQASRTFAWRLQVSDGLEALTWKAVAATATLSDGEEGALPVLSSRVLVTESLPLPIRGPRTRTFDFQRLRLAGASSTLRNQSLTVQMVSNPAWYAVMALPYLMEYPYECAEQTFNRLYANALASHIAQSDPRMEKTFALWRGTPALDSPLEKNQDLKSVMLEETPWVRDAAQESQARRRVGVLFERGRMAAELDRAQRRLRELQYPDGSWPWFPGGPADDYITLYITTGFGRLQHLGVDVDRSLAVRAVGPLDDWSVRTYRDVLAHSDPGANHLTSMVALYLYARSFFITDRPVAGDAKTALDYWQKQARRYWLDLDRQSEAHVALGLQRFGDARTPRAITNSLRERAVTSEELGMFWRDTEYSWWWYRAPIETQAVMIEAFDEVAHDADAVEECRVWLLKQKQTQDWKTTKATADAVYALLLRGRDVLASDAIVAVSLGGQRVQPERVEAGTGFFERRYRPDEITTAMAAITVAKSDTGVAWGSVHWQYLEDMAKVTPYAGTPLTLEKTVFARRNSARGPELIPIQGPVGVGDELVVRVVLRTDRDMEYVHLKDYRGSGVEPVNVLSGWRSQDGLGYYEQTRDVASHFFIAYLPKGTYVFEYPVRVQHRGRYQTGMAQIQCMYAPEFNSHSGSVVLDVK